MRGPGVMFIRAAERRNAIMECYVNSRSRTAKRNNGHRPVFATIIPLRAAERPNAIMGNGLFSKSFGR